MTVVDDIAAAFGVEPIPKEPLLEPAYLDPNNQGDEGATEYFSGKPWNVLDVESLRYHSIALYMFTPQAHRYYLPAFMVASVKTPLEADVIPDNILFHFARYQEPYWWERIRVLSPRQCDAVDNFIRTIADVGNARHVEPALEGLAKARQMPDKSLERTREE